MLIHVNTKSLKSGALLAQFQRQYANMMREKNNDMPIYKETNI
jgi:hypothetical protein